MCCEIFSFQVMTWMYVVFSGKKKEEKVYEVTNYLKLCNETELYCEIVDSV